MINLGKETIHRYKEFIEWMDTLSDLDDSTWFTPVAEGKATVAEIVSHLKNWDNYLINIIIPSIKNGEGMVFPDIFTKHVTVNGVENCPHTDTPYSLLYIIYEFIEHDIHHKNQILSAI